jgi:hypothetical protein
MAKKRETHTAEQEKDPSGKRRPMQKRLWARTGFSEKTLWDWMHLLIVPLVLAGIGPLFEMQQD